MVSSVVKENVKLMASADERGMRKFLNTESHGGNASSYKGKLCVGANFWFESETGKIMEFTTETDTRFSTGIFKVQLAENFLDVEQYNARAMAKYLSIVGYEIISGGVWGKQATAQAEVAIQETVKLYNQFCEAMNRRGIFKW